MEKMGDGEKVGTDKKYQNKNSKDRLRSPIYFDPPEFVKVNRSNIKYHL